MSFRLLGPVEVWAGSTRVEAGPPRQRAVLAALAADAGRVVAVDVLVDRVWGQDPPERARRTLHTHIARVRRVVERAGAMPDERVRVVRRADGYALEVDADQVDLLRFRRLAAAARRGERPDTDRVGLLDEALELWRGTPLAGLAGEWAQRQRDSWQLERLSAVTDWARAALRLGQHARVIATAGALVELHPYDEPLAVLLGWALAADGRRSEAAEYCRTVSHRLRQDAGIDPGPQLRALHEAIVGDQQLPDLATPAPRPAPTPVSTPAQLPGDVPGFAGRTSELARLDTALETAARHAPTAVVITAVSGTAGVGKTALAVHWAHQIRDRFPDGQLYMNLRGFDPARQLVEPAVAVRGFLEALGVPAERIPTSLDARAGLYRSLLNGKRMLVVLDNARDADHVRTLLPGTPTALAVVTSRNQLADLVAADGAHPLILDLLGSQEAHALLAGRIDPSRLAAEPQAVQQIITACAGLPLALALVAARAATHPNFPLAALAAELTAADDPRDGLDAGGVLAQVRSVFDWSYTTLAPPAARLFRLLGLHPGPDFSVPSAASLTATPPVSTRRLLAELARAGLIVEHAVDRYVFHDLLRAYAVDLTQTVDLDSERQAAAERLVDHYTHTAHTAASLLHPTRDPIQIPLSPPAPGAAPQRPTDQQTALAWLTTEHPVLMAVQRLAAATGLHARTWQLAWALDTFLNRRGHWQDLADTWQTAQAAAENLGSLTGTAYAHRALAWAATLLDAHDQAHIHLCRALDLFSQADDEAGQAHTHHAISTLWHRQDRHDKALDHARRALALHRATGHRRGQALTLNAVGWYHVLLGDHTQALAYCQEAILLSQQIGDRDGEGGAWDSLGYAHHHLGRFAEAVECYQHALALRRDLRDRYQQATTLTRLGDTHHASGHPDEAETAWTDALDILEDLDHPDAQSIRARLANPQHSS